MSRLSLPIAADHAGYQLKEDLKKALPEIDWIDLGTQDASRVDYPDFADRVARKVQESGGMGVLICGSGQGMAIRANRFKGVRAALVWSLDSTRVSREHNDANVICLGARFIDLKLARELVELFVQTKFEGGRHTDRVKKIERPV